jgi:hypothetical protein
MYPVSKIVYLSENKTRHLSEVQFNTLLTSLLNCRITFKYLQKVYEALIYSIISPTNLALKQRRVIIISKFREI